MGYNVPLLKELGVDESKLEPCKFPGGETEGLRRLNEKISLANGSWVRSSKSLKLHQTVCSLPQLYSVLTSNLDVYHAVKCIINYWKLIPKENILNPLFH